MTKSQSWSSWLNRWAIMALVLAGVTRIQEAHGQDVEADRLRERGRTVVARVVAPKKLRVEVTAPTAKVMDGAKVLATVSKGQQFDVQRVNGVWYGIEVPVNGTPKLGWVLNSDLTLVTGEAKPAAPAAAASAEWQKFAPPGSGFSVLFPGTAKTSKRSANGVEVVVYACETPDANYVVGYFAFPPGMTLTLDAVVSSMVSQMKGKLLSQKNVNLAGHPGREFTAQLPSGALTRQRFAMANGRFYQVGLDGAASLVEGSDATRFFDSFKLNK
ncbi:MAG TPA: hypothetical protein VHY91_07630 [Pirellulales bacterium]|nr:hypothetical protein [Pirellulales bacterium]